MSFHSACYRKTTHNRFLKPNFSRTKPTVQQTLDHYTKSKRNVSPLTDPIKKLKQYWVNFLETSTWKQSSRFWQRTKCIKNWFFLAHVRLSYKVALQKTLMSTGTVQEQRAKADVNQGKTGQTRTAFILWPVHLIVALGRGEGKSIHVTITSAFFFSLSLLCSLTYLSLFLHENVHVFINCICIKIYVCSFT